MRRSTLARQRQQRRRRAARLRGRAARPRTRVANLYGGLSMCAAVPHHPTPSMQALYAKRQTLSAVFQIMECG